MASVTQPAGASAAGKGKEKKPKGQKINIDDMIDSSNFKMPVDSSWAEMMEDEDVHVSPMSHVSLPSAPKSVQGPDIDFDAIPANGPFRAQVANLQYEVTEDQLAEMFNELSVKNLRLNVENGRANGTASVEFSTKGDLIKGLEMNNKQLNGRSVRIYLPNQDRYGDRGGGRGGRSYVDNTPMNWRSADRGAGGITSRSDGAFPGKPDKVFPPPTVGYGESRGYGGSRGGDREGGYRAPRNDYGGGGGGGFGGGRRDYGGDRRRDGDDGGRRDGGRRDRFGDEGGRASGNWGRGAPRTESGPESAEPEASGGNWRSARPAEAAPPPTSDRDGGRYGGPRGGDQDSMPPTRDSYGPRGGDSYGGGRRREDDGFERPTGRRRDDDGFERPTGRRRDDNGYERPTGGRDRDFDRSVPARGGGGDDQYEPRRTSGSDDHEPPRSFAPAAPPRERAMSGRSDRSNPDHHSQHDLPQAAPKEDEPPRRSRPPELRPMIANLLAGSEEEEDKPASYSSIFGSAKPVDTLKREMEIEKKLAEEKAAAAEKEAPAKEAAAAARALKRRPVK